MQKESSPPSAVECGKVGCYILVVDWLERFYALTDAGYQLHLMDSKLTPFNENYQESASFVKTICNMLLRSRDDCSHFIDWPNRSVFFRITRDGSVLAYGNTELISAILAVK